jgi:hypothetical protein
MSKVWERWSNWELWPFWLRYLNISPMWFWYCLRARSLWFFTPSNPTIAFGGFEGESKKEIYEQLPKHSYPKTIYIDPKISFSAAITMVGDAGFQYPFVVKPDVGMSGILFRKIRNEEELKNYHSQVPVTYIIQDLITLPIEFSVFYYRYPDQQKGVITGFLHKEPMHVIGDGMNTLKELILTHPKAKFRMPELLSWHNEKIKEVITNGEKYYLSHAANLNRGADFINLHDQIDEKLHDVFDKLNLYSKTFYYGRYDLKAASIEDLKNGKNYLLIEYNGSGAEPNHVYNSGLSLRAAQNEILRHWKALYEISAFNHKKGISYCSTREGWRFLRAASMHFRKLKEIDTIV